MFIELVLALITAYLFWYLIDQTRFRGHPSGPIRVPLLGNLLQLGYYTLLSESKTPSDVLYKLATARDEREMMHVRMGMEDFVVFSSYESITDLLSRDGLGNRKIFKYYEDRNDNGNVGIITSNDPVWSTLRRFTIRTLREFGFGKSAPMDAVITEEANKFVDYLRMQGPKSTTVTPSETGPFLFHITSDLFGLTVVNVLWRLVTGESYDLGNERILEMIRLGTQYSKSMRVDDIGVCYPILRDIFPVWTKRNLQNECVRVLKQFLEGVVKEVGNDDECFIGVFLKRIKEEEGKGGKDAEIFNHTQLIYTLFDLFLAGSETTSKTLTFALLHMIRNPTIQNRVHKELDTLDNPDVMGVNELREALPYSHAVILETMRYNHVVPITAPFECHTDLQIRGFRIKAGTPLMCNVEGIHYDERFWGDPHQFRPERFIIEEPESKSRVNLDLAEHVVPFGKGKRACLGQALAEATLLRYFVTLFKHFRFEKVGEGEPSIVPKPGVTYTPETFDVKAFWRKQ